MAEGNTVMFDECDIDLEAMLEAGLEEDDEAMAALAGLAKTDDFADPAATALEYTGAAGVGAASPTLADASFQDYHTPERLSNTAEAGQPEFDIPDYVPSQHDDGLGQDEDDLFGSEEEATKKEARPKPAAGRGSSADAEVQRSAENVPPPAPHPVPRSPQQNAEAPSSQRSAASGGFAFVDESRYLRDPAGALVAKWAIDYASRGGGGRAMCRDTECLERHNQAGMKTIEKDTLRICRRLFVDKDGSEPELMTLWYHARCIFNTFLRSRKSTRCIESPEDLEGWEKINMEDQALIRRIIANKDEVRVYKGLAPKGTVKTPVKKRVLEPGQLDEEAPAFKKAKKLLADQPLKKGDRVWTYCRVRPDAPAGDGGVAAIGALGVKSTKPELGMIVSESDDFGHMIIQFESAEHEKERIEKFQIKKYAKVRAWLRYPRIFEGKKQKIQYGWIVLSRTPPRLCSCIKQEWGHYCPIGIACGRGTQAAVFGVCQ